MVCVSTSLQPYKRFDLCLEKAWACFKGKIARICDQNLKRLCLGDFWNVCAWARGESEGEESSQGLEQPSVLLLLLWCFVWQVLGCNHCFTGPRTEGVYVLVCLFGAALGSSLGACVWTGLMFVVVKWPSTECLYLGSLRRCYRCSAPCRQQQYRRVTVKASRGLCEGNKFCAVCCGKPSSPIPPHHVMPAVWLGSN